MKSAKQRVLSRRLTTSPCVPPWRGHAAGGGKYPGHRVVQLRARENRGHVTKTPPVMSTFPLLNNVAICPALAVVMLPVAVNIPVTGS